MNRIIVLEETISFGGVSSVIHPVLVCAGGVKVLADCGYPGHLQSLEEAAEKAGTDLRGLKAVVITHHDFDHIGALAELQAIYPDALVYASEFDADYIEGRKKPLRLAQAEALYDTLPDSEKPRAQIMQRVFASVPSARVDVRLRGGDMLPWCGGIQAVATPGHMPGHISLYLPSFKTLIAGDALALENGRLGIANPEYTLDMPQALASVRQLMPLDIRRVICYHGGEFSGDVRQALSAVANGAAAD